MVTPLGGGCDLRQQQPLAPRPAARRALPCPQWPPHGPPRVRAGGWLQWSAGHCAWQAAGTSLAADISPATHAGHRPSGRRSFRKQRTVNPLTGPIRLQLLCSSSSRPCGRPSTAAASRRQRHDGTGYRPHLGRAQRRIRVDARPEACQRTGARRCRAIRPKSQGRPHTHISPAYRGGTTGCDVEIHTALRTRFTPLGLFRGYHGSHRFRPLLD